jgi:threonine/homoserine/homoserine lactone efflux protein
VRHLRNPAAAGLVHHPEMQTATLLLFAATVLPLICTPGPDMLFITAQTLSAGAGAGLRATAGVCLGYVVHSALAALGVAAIIAASPLLFEALRWLGAAYLLYLASQLIRSALRPGSLGPVAGRGGRGTVRRGFLTAVLNPKGMMIYFAILPQFMEHDGNIALQATVLSAIFIGLCALVYSVLSLAVGTAGRKTGFSDAGRRWVEGISGGLLILAAGRLATR